MRHVAQGGRQITVTTRRERSLRGYAAHRRRYDERRRAEPLDDASRAYARLLRGDPCSYCGAFCGQMAADHIVGLDAGGEHSWENLTAAGRPCNAAKRERALLSFLLDRGL